jgi:hypothetical protein
MNGVIPVKQLFLFFIMATLAACASEEQPTMTTVLLAPSSTNKVTATLVELPFSASLTHTLSPTPSFTPNPSKTVTPTPTKKPTNTTSLIPPATFSPSPTSTFDLKRIATYTPAPPADCPEDNAFVDIPDLTEKDNDEFENEILDLLNAGAIKQLLSEYGCRPSALCLEKQIASQDLTADGVPELVIRGGFPIGNVFVYGCQHGQYVTLLREEAEFDTTPSIIAIRDMNLNGVNDLVIEQITCGYCVGVRVFEWSGVLPLSK